MDNTIYTLDQCTANAERVKEQRCPERIRQNLADTRAEIFKDVNDFYESDSVLGYIDGLLTPFSSLLNLCDAVERDSMKEGQTSRSHQDIPCFSVLSSSMYYLTETIKLIVKLGDHKDYIDRLQECLCVQQEAEGHTITGK